MQIQQYFSKAKSREREREREIERERGSNLLSHVMQ